MIVFPIICGALGIILEISRENYAAAMWATITTLTFIFIAATYKDKDKENDDDY
jgi:hypothetical protein